MISRHIKNFFLLAIVTVLFSSCSHENTGTSHPKDFRQKRSPRDNDFIKNGGYKIKKPTNPFTSVNEVKQELQDIPPIPQTLKNIENKKQEKIEKLKK